MLSALKTLNANVRYVNVDEIAVGCLEMLQVYLAKN